MTITFSIGTVFQAMALVVMLPLVALSYVGGWKVFLDKDLDMCEKVGGGLLWLISLLSLLGTYAILVAPPMSTWNW